MDKFEERAMNTRFIMLILGIGMVIASLSFDLGQLEIFLIVFGLTTSLLNLVAIIYKMNQK